MRISKLLTQTVVVSLLLSSTVLAQDFKLDQSKIATSKFNVKSPAKKLDPKIDDFVDFSDAEKAISNFQDEHNRNFDALLGARSPAAAAEDPCAAEIVDQNGDSAFVRGCLDNYSSTGTRDTEPINIVEQITFLTVRMVIPLPVERLSCHVELGSNNGDLFIGTSDVRTVCDQLMMAKSLNSLATFMFSDFEEIGNNQGGSRVFSGNIVGLAIH